MSSSNNNNSNSNNSASTSSSGNQACAACKFQRRRCSAECPLARYFPAEQNHRFMNCKRLFGVSNMVRFLKEVDSVDRDDTMKSLMFEADARERDPVNGCLGIINRLKDEINKLVDELQTTREQLNYYLEHQQALAYQQHFQATAAAAAAAAATHHNSALSSIPYTDTIPPMDHGVDNSQIVTPASSHDNFASAKQIFDGRQQDYSSTTRSPFEHRFSEELPLNSVHLVNVPDHELKLFSLTSQH